MRKSLLTLTLLCLASTSALAGGPYILTTSGTPSKWSTTAAIEYHPEEGVCGSFSNAQMLTKLDENLDRWTNLTEVNLDMSVDTSAINVDITASNYTTFYVGSDASGNTFTTGLTDGINPIMFDDTGGIIAAVAGSSNRFTVLGFANPDGFTSDFATIVDGQAVINCRCLSGNALGACTSGGTTIEFSEDETNFTIVHEIGHFLNLDHTQVNEDLINNGNSADDDDIPTMYPISVNAAEQITPQRDDIVALAGIYPSTSFNNSVCTVTGVLHDANGDELRCADVQAITSDTADTVAFVSGALAPAEDNNGDGDTVDDGECASDCGEFTLKLEPGKNYSLVVKPINSSFTGGSGISPCANDQISTIDEETITTVSGSDCTAGGTVTFASAFTTTSTGGTTGSGGGSDSSSASSLGCELNPAGAAAGLSLFGALTAFALAAWFALRRRG